MAYWTFSLINRTQQVYLCQQVNVYFEDLEPGTTRQTVDLITATGSLNVAENRTDPQVTLDWVQAKNPGAVVKLAESLAEAGSLRGELAAMFPEAQIFIVTPDALGTGPAGLYARLYLAKALYPDWYEDVDLSVVSAELGVANIPID